MTDGTDTVTIADGAGTVGSAGYALVDPGWAPQVAGLRRSLLGGYGPYADIEEEISIDIFDTTAANCYTSLDTLTRLLDKAKRWWLRGELISPVVLKWVPQGSTVHASSGAVLKAVVLGTPGDEELNGTAVESDFEHTGFLFEISNIKIRILRRGPWTGTADTTGASGSAANTTVLTRTFATHPISSPVDITIAGFDQAATPTVKAGYLIVGSNVNDIQVVEAETATATGYTSVADATALSRGGSVLRYTPTGTASVTSGTGTLTFIGGPIAVIAAIRNNSATTTWLVRANLSGFGQAASTPSIPIDTSTTQPRQYLLGVVSTAANKISVTVTASAASGTLDIDYLIVVNLRDETVNIIGHDDIALTSAGAGAASLTAQFNPGSAAQPLLYVSGSAGNVPATYRGALPFMTIGANLYCLWTATNGAFWRFTNTSNAVLNVTVNATRYRSYLSPQ